MPCSPSVIFRNVTLPACLARTLDRHVLSHTQSSSLSLKKHHNHHKQPYSEVMHQVLFGVLAKNSQWLSQQQKMQTLLTVCVFQTPSRTCFPSVCPAPLEHYSAVAEVSPPCQLPPTDLPNLNKI